MAHALARGRARDVYAYEFNDRTAPAPEPLRNVPFPVGASHSLELRYLFDVGDNLRLDPAQRRLSDQMIDYWSAFVRSGAPRANGQPGWNDVSRQPSVLSLQPDGSRMIGDFDAEHQCQFWAGLQ
jgi:para-nitrobenzyl esterase